MAVVRRTSRRVPAVRLVVVPSRVVMALLFMGSEVVRPVRLCKVVVHPLKSLVRVLIPDRTLASPPDTREDREFILVKVVLTRPVTALQDELVRRNVALMLLAVLDNVPLRSEMLPWARPNVPPAAVVVEFADFSSPLAELTTSPVVLSRPVQELTRDVALAK